MVYMMPLDAISVEFGTAMNSVKRKTLKMIPQLEMQKWKQALSGPLECLMLSWRWKIAK